MNNFGLCFILKTLGRELKALDAFRPHCSRTI